MSAGDPNLASYLRIEERELEAGGLNWRRVPARSFEATALLSVSNQPSERVGGS
jgi:hypothetical protein